MPRSRSRRLPKGVYQRGDVLWFRTTVNGVEHRESLRTGDVAVAERKAETIRARLMAEAYGGEVRRSYVEAFVAWSDHAATQISAKTMQRYAVSLGQMDEILRPLMIDEVSDAVVRQIITRRRQTKVTTATIRRDLTALSSVLSFAEDEGWCKENAALGRLKKLKERRDPIVLPTADAVERVIARAPGNLSHMVRFAAETGCRQDEMVRARWQDINMSAGEMRIVGKRNKLRTISLCPGAMAVLRAVPRRLRCPWVFWHGEGEPYANVASRFVAIVGSARKAAQKDGVEMRAFRFHDLRHLFAVSRLKGGWSLYRVQRHLGHGSVKTTEIYLAHLTADEEAAAKADARFTAQDEAVSNVP